MFSATAQDGARPVVGIVGAGQLARMTIEAATPLAIDVHLLAAAPDDGAALIWPRTTIGTPEDPRALDFVAAASTVITFDHELVDVPQLQRLEAAGHRVFPAAATMAIAQNKLLQRHLFERAGLLVPPFREVCAASDVPAFAAEHGWPVVVKAIRGGYDGRGVWVLRDLDGAGRLVEDALAAGTPLLVEAYVSIERELAVLVARRPGGETVVYPVVETVQVDGICREVIAPAPISAPLRAEAQRQADRVAAVTGVVGVLAVELFEAGGSLIVNEIATRPHNSGHFSIEGCETSQFENHLRAILDWPLGSTALQAPVAVMVNVLGRGPDADPRRNVQRALAVPGVHVHLYEKEPRPGRKVGHVTALGADVGEVQRRARLAVELLLGGTVEAVG